MAVAYGPTFAVTVGRRNHVEVMHLCQDLEGVFHKKIGHISGCPPPFLYVEPGSFLSPTQFFSNLFYVGVK